VSSFQCNKEEKLREEETRGDVLVDAVAVGGLAAQKTKADERQRQEDQGQHKSSVRRDVFRNRRFSQELLHENINEAREGDLFYLKIRVVGFDLFYSFGKKQGMAQWVLLRNPSEESHTMNRVIKIPVISTLQNIFCN
jgi:hypothetical protein